MSLEEFSSGPAESNLLFRPGELYDLAYTALRWPVSGKAGDLQVRVWAAREQEADNFHVDPSSAPDLIPRLRSIGRN